MASSNGLSPVFDRASEDSAQSELARMPDSYFPASHRSSFSSTASSVALEPSGGLRLRPEPPSLRPAQPPRATTTAVPASSATNRVVVLDAMSRDFPKPDHEPTLEEMLARPPQKWSVGHYVKNAREAKLPVRDKEEQARAFADAKRELLAAKAELEQSSGGGR